MKLSTWSGLFPIALFAGLAGCGSKETPNVAAQAPPPTVEVTEVKAGDADIYADFPGQTYARNLVDVRGRVEGYIEKWLFRPGQEVKVGQALYILDLRPFQAQVEQAQGALHQSEADLSFAQRQVSLLQAEANLAASQSNLVKAKQDYERLKPLVEQDAAAKQDLDAAVAALASAEASVRANQANVEQVRLTTETQVQSTQGKVQAQRGALETANLNVKYGTIVAPISGLDRGHDSAGGRVGESECDATADDDCSAGPDLGAIQSQRVPVSGVGGQEGRLGERYFGAAIDSGGQLDISASGEGYELAQSGGPENRHLGTSG